MNLLVDIGNTRVKWALAHDRVLVDTGAIAHDAHDDWTTALPGTRVETVFVASVAHERAVLALGAHAQARDVSLRRVVSGRASGALTNGYKAPAQLGVDRWMACIGAQARGTGSVLVADVGTALTLDRIAADARHEGGLIAPGVTSMRSALRAVTQLAPTHTQGVPEWLARDTDHAIAAGTLRCAISLLDAAAAQMTPDRLLLTGGEAALLAAHLAQDWEVAPHLVLEGLALHAEREAEQANRGSQAAPQASE